MVKQANKATEAQECRGKGGTFVARGVCVRQRDHSGGEVAAPLNARFLAHCIPQPVIPRRQTVRVESTSLSINLEICPTLRGKTQRLVTATERLGVWLETRGWDSVDKGCLTMIA